ncbi:hypothetical protein UFOVP231_55 [uncultured Caudovirales phage]|uniref:Uncharacterized protein n=1 Tax=uncultured Caudovirales phage TaxID=2100421 RepID=A0A6J7WTG3_9CAUD|nr:hypothetical protein UFOVP231_55 [uncultured Caudovirales phage]
MDNIDMIFAENKDIIIESLIMKIREQSEDLDSAEDNIDHLANSLNQAQQYNAKLVEELTALKKASKALKVPKVAKALEVEAPAPKSKGGRPKKIVAAPAKRKLGRPKKAVG